MRELSSSLESIKDHYDVVVVGSGYGGGIAASRLSRAGKRVCVLERGREFRPGEYPNTAMALVGEVQSDLPLAHIGPATALFDIRYNPDINVVIGCGLGGTSLINAAIALRPDPRIFSDACWPAEIRDDAELQRYFGYAEAMLKPALYPDEYPRLPKLDAWQHNAEALQQPFRRVPLMVNFRELEGGINHVGAKQGPCVNCGDCVSGCNFGAKNTVLMNYLPDAVNHGAEIYTEISARRVERGAGRWRVPCTNPDGENALTVDADIVILAAGTLGSTEILLRSADSGLRLSKRLGSRFSANGDTVGFAYNTDRVIRGVGFGASAPGETKPVGPCSTGIMDLRDGRAVQDGMIVVDGAIPGALAAFLPGLLAAGAKLTGSDTDGGWRDELNEFARKVESKLLGARAGAIENTLFYLVVTQDDAGGEMYLEHDRVRIRWPGVGRQAPFETGSELMRRATQALGGTYIPNPAWNEFTNHSLVTGHPLGGCAMADDAGDGVVNHKGQVYAAAAGTSVHDGLYVMDGAIVPRSLGANPALTISALAERCCHHLARDHGWTIDTDLANRSTPQRPAQPSP
jgi:cholesterol oxidase